MGLKKHLSGDALIKSVRDRVLLEKYPVLMNPVYSWKDCIMSGLAVFGFKMPSLLQFEKAKSSEFSIRNNLRSLYGVEQAPSDTCLRGGKMLEKYRYVDGHYRLLKMAWRLTTLIYPCLIH
ncbi:MAG: hypothetical protein GW760_05575 [Legionella sp.]|jgi:hypothetical protein|nr:hypothetical protein [Legionella sp.]